MESRIDSSAAEAEQKAQADTPSSSSSPIAIVIHGGAGTILKKNLTDEMQAQYHATLKLSVETGHAVLKAGGAAHEAVVAAIEVMEESVLFNAGRGGVFCHEGHVEHDASIMRGDGLLSGAITGTTTVRNPIKLAAKVMNESSGAEEYAALVSQEESAPVEFVENAFFRTERRYAQLLAVRDGRPGGEAGKQRVALSEFAEDNADLALMDVKNAKRGTVGCVALDAQGNLCAGTSTGGMTNKRFKRIGDSPIIGSGTYADNRTCAISATGHGEFFMRANVAFDIHARMKYTQCSLHEAAEGCVNDALVNDFGGEVGEGGIIGIDKHGNVEMCMNSAGMYRAWIEGSGDTHSAIYKDEE